MKLSLLFAPLLLISCATSQGSSTAAAGSCQSEQKIDYVQYCRAHKCTVKLEDGGYAVIDKKKVDKAKVNTGSMVQVAEECSNIAHH